MDRNKITVEEIRRVSKKITGPGWTALSRLCQPPNYILTKKVDGRVARGLFRLGLIHPCKFKPQHWSASLLGQYVVELKELDDQSNPAESPNAE